MEEKQKRNRRERVRKRGPAIFNRASIKICPNLSSVCDLQSSFFFVDLRSAIFSRSSSSLSPIYNTDDWSPSGDVYVGGTTGLLIWAVTLVGIAGGALLVYSTSALAQ